MLQGRLRHDVDGLVEIGEKALFEVFRRPVGNINGDDEVCSLFFCRADGYGLGQSAVNVSTAADQDGLEHVGDGGGCADCLSGIAAVEGDGFGRFEVGGDGGEFNREVLNRAVTDFAVDVVLQFLSFDKAAGG